MTTAITENQKRSEHSLRSIFAARSEMYRAVDPKRYAKQERKLMDALLDLSFDYVYFGLAAAKVGGRFRLVPGIGTACISTAGDCYFDPTFADSLTHGQKAWVWAHELSHNLYGHSFRRHGREPELWNITGDLSINAILRDVFEGSWVSEPGIKILIPDQSRWDWAAEKHYDAMLQDQQPEPGPGNPDDDESDDDGDESGQGQGQGPRQDDDDSDDQDNGGSSQDDDSDDSDEDGQGGSDDGEADDGDGDAPGKGQPGSGESKDGEQSGQGSDEPADSSNVPGPSHPAVGQGCAAWDFDDEGDDPRAREYEWREISVQSESLQKQSGKEKGAGLCKLSEVPDPKVQWRNVLRKGCALAKAASGKDRKTWKKRGRRSQLCGSPVVWPGWVGTKARACVVIDTSGSMSDKALHQAVSETLSIARESGIPIYLVTHDHGVQWEGWIRPNEKAASVEASLVGRGGTCAREAYARVDNPRAQNCRHGGTGCECSRRLIRFDVMVHLTDCYLSWPPWPESVKRVIVARIETDKPHVPEGADVFDVDVEGTY